MQGNVITLILTQMMYYTIAMLLGLFIIGFLQRGFLIKFLKVRASFGKLALGKARGPTRDYFVIAEPKDGFLTFKDGKDIKKICIPKDLLDKPIFYRCLGAIWFDFHEEKNALVVSMPDFSIVSGFDAIKFEDLYTRCLYKPTVQDNTTKIIIIMLVVLIFLVIILGILVFVMRGQIAGIGNQVAAALAPKVPPPSI